MLECPKAIVQHLDALMQNGITDSYSLALYYEGNMYEAHKGSVRSSTGAAIAVQPNTPFNIGSVTKIITASLVVKLAENGQLSLDDKVLAFIPAYRYPHTIRQLMLHTAGFAPPEGLSWPVPEQLEPFKSKIYNHPVTTAADQRAEYYTQGYTVLMEIAEEASGMSLEQLGLKYLFQPLGMTDSTFEISGWTPGTYTLPYDGMNAGPVKELEGLAVTGDSGLYSTASDLLRFAVMLVSGGQYGEKQVFSPAAARLMNSEVTQGRFNKTPTMWVKGEQDLYGCFGDLLSPSAMGHPGFSGCMLVLDPSISFAGVLVTASQKLHADWSNYRRLWNVAMSSLSEHK
ncbi:serine hydrolase domain-containing protein [Paenibacillus luteus]|uniref:serine hydrolase domain-containing protein n=1 Tax=Paenibacillus luteus TaxID=2545753 RepID=UPI0011422C2F|nr:serine hydrolase [Paenibacillus luteus]